MRIAPVLLLFAACDTTAATIDAPVGSHDTMPLPTSCGVVVPTTAPPMVMLSGAVADSSFSGSANPLAGATIMAFTGSDTAIGSVVSENGGIYQLMTTTGGQPIAYITLTKSGYTGTRFYPRAPIALDQSLTKIPLFTTADAAMFATMAGVTQDPSKGVVVAVITDCQGTKLSGATATAAGGTVKYLHGDGTTNGAATDAMGVALIFNVSGSVTVAAAMASLTFYARPVTVTAGSFVIDTISEQ